MDRHATKNDSRTFAPLVIVLIIMVRDTKCFRKVGVKTALSSKSVWSVLICATVLTGSNGAKQGSLNAYHVLTKGSRFCIHMKEIKGRRFAWLSFYDILDWAYFKIQYIWNITSRTTVAFVDIIRIFSMYGCCMQRLGWTLDSTMKHIGHVLDSLLLWPLLTLSFN